MIYCRLVMSCASCQHVNLHATCHIKIHSSIEKLNAVLHECTLNNNDTDTEHMATFTWGIACRDCNSSLCRCNTQPINVGNNAFLLSPIPCILTCKLAKCMEQPDNRSITFYNTNFTSVSCFQVDRDLVSFKLLIDKYIKDETEHDLKRFDIMPNTSDTFVMPANDMICVVISSKVGTDCQKIACFFKSISESTQSKNNSCEYPEHEHSKVITNNLKYRMACKDKSDAKLHLNWMEFLSVIDHANTLNDQIHNVCLKMNSHYEKQINTYVANKANMMFWQAKSIQIQHQLPCEFLDTANRLNAQSLDEMQKMRALNVTNAMATLEGALSSETFNHVQNVLQYYNALQERVSWNQVHIHDTNRMDIVNIRALYVGIRALETFLEHVVSHKDNHIYLDRYVYRSYTYQLNQILANNEFQAIQLDHDVFAKLNQMLQDIQNFTLLLQNAQHSLLPYINSKRVHEIASRVLIQSLISQSELSKKIVSFKDTRMQCCHQFANYSLIQNISDNDHYKAVQSLGDMLEIDVYNQILHPSLKFQVYDLLRKVQHTLVAHRAPLTSEDTKCLKIFNEHTRPLADYAIFGPKRCASVKIDDLYKFLQPDAKAGTGYNNEFISECVTQRRRDMQYQPKHTHFI